ncbi:unnamed protein product [Tuber melanosporum]|uniref:(Perigord truffle) hypothetical protein n=1 Tax=Tuber melanosporum (strain Mel28) TaxID=656061 RepID=D5GA10_TUBMM|nr:uncharacterized protein GSTUM_00003485001 [Tuber melanosporum]CAZ81353.1 unnamed protein product [Tuber melanosporum]
MVVTQYRNVSINRLAFFMTPMLTESSTTPLTSLQIVGLFLHSTSIPYRIPLPGLHIHRSTWATAVRTTGMCWLSTLEPNNRHQSARTEKFGGVGGLVFGRKGVSGGEGVVKVESIGLSCFTVGIRGGRGVPEASGGVL